MPQLIPHYLKNALLDNKNHMVFPASVAKHLGCVVCNFIKFYTISK